MGSLWHNRDAGGANSTTAQMFRPFSLQGLPAMPGKQPDIADAVSLANKQKKLSTMLTAGSRRSTFLTGPLGDTSQAPIGTKTLLGG